MSSVVSIVLKSTGVVGKIPGYDTYGEALPYLLDTLDAMAARLEVEKPSGFFFELSSAHAELFRGNLPEQIVSRMQRQREWHDCREGLKTFGGLLALLQSLSAEERQATLGPTRICEKAIIQELAAIKAILETGTKRNDFFRIEAEL
jgi:hypothetical protein